MELSADVARVDFGGCVLLLDDGRLMEATARGKLMGPKKALGNALVVGDRASCVIEGDRAMVEGVRRRRNAFSRRAPGKHPAEQVVAANLDRIVVVASVVHPEFKPGLVDRVLAQAEHSGIDARLVLTKSDLAPAARARDLLADYKAAGFEGFATSVVTRHGIDALRQDCRGARCLFVGHSGVGKSTLLNALEPRLELIAGMVNAKTRKGRHTTSAAWLLRPEPGLDLIDTPGIRAFGLWGIDSRDLQISYREFRPFLGKCRFVNCRHEDDAGCALRVAVERGRVARLRFDSYLKLRAELEREEAHQIERVRPTTRYRR